MIAAPGGEAQDRARALASPAPPASDDGVFRTWQSIRDLACGHLAEVEHLLKTYVKDRDQLQGIDSRELLKRFLFFADEDIRPVGSTSVTPTGSLPGFLSKPTHGGES